MTFEEIVDKIVRPKKRAYQLTFSSPYSQVVLKDLARFCRANQSCFLPDARLHAVLEGRREVWLRVQQYLKLDENQLADLITHKPGD